MLKLMIDGKEAVKGQKVTDFRGDKGILKSWRSPKDASSTGRVYVEYEGTDFSRELFPNVIDAKFEEV